MWPLGERGGSGTGRLGPSRRGVLAGTASAVATAVLPRPARAGVQLRLGHGLPRTHPVHRAMQNFADLVQQRTGGEVTVTLFADGVLGEEQALIQQVRIGNLDLTKASGSVLGEVNSLYRALDLPFLLRDKDHLKRVLGGPIGERILAGRGEATMLGLCFYDAGARSFYGRQPIARPENLAGLRIRVQPAAVMIAMVQALGAEAVPLPWGVVFSALRTGLIDCAENNLTALDHGRHAEVARHFAFTEHTMVPDVLLISSRSWNALAPRHRDILKSAAVESALLQSELWLTAERESRDFADRLGVAFTVPEKGPFIERLAGLRRDFVARDGLGDLVAAIEQA